MNRKLMVFLALVMCFGLILCSCTKAGEVSNIADKLIRFHVIANSDSPEDQALKLKVRDRVLEKIGPEMEKYKDKMESQAFLEDNIENIKSVAEKQISELGKDYNVDVVLGKSYFPTKVYSAIALPAGEYDALKVVIGKGEGKNWWCVMFPPLCFVDITHGVTDKNTEDELKTVLKDAEYESILTDAAKSNKGEAVKKPIATESEVNADKKVKDDDKVEIKFKSVEMAQSLWTRIEKLLKTNNK